MPAHPPKTQSDQARQGKDGKVCCKRMHYLPCDIEHILQEIAKQDNGPMWAVTTVNKLNAQQGGVLTGYLTEAANLYFGLTSRGLLSI